MAHFSDLGAHCSDPYCRQGDFLPFQCEFCKKTFCLEHFEPKNHGCPDMNAKDKRVLLCPLCNAAVRIQHPQSPTEVWEKHSRSTECSSAASRPQPRKDICPVKGCREQLTTINKFQCRKCNTEVCLGHRFETDHSCAEWAKKPPRKLSQKHPSRRSSGGSKESSLKKSCFLQ